MHSLSANLCWTLQWARLWVGAVNSAVKKGMTWCHIGLYGWWHRLVQQQLWDTVGPHNYHLSPQSHSSHLYALACTTEGRGWPPVGHIHRLPRPLASSWVWPLGAPVEDLEGQSVEYLLSAFISLAHEKVTKPIWSLPSKFWPSTSLSTYLFGPRGGNCPTAISPGLLQYSLWCPTPHPNSPKVV